MVKNDRLVEMENGDRFIEQIMRIVCLFLCFSRTMSTNSKKHKDFVSTPMGSKDVTKIPGIGEKIGGNMNEREINFAYEVFGMFLVVKKNKDNFFKWLKQFVANAEHREECYKAMEEWSKKYFE